MQAAEDVNLNWGDVFDFCVCLGNSALSHRSWSCFEAKNYFARMQGGIIDDDSIANHKSLLGCNCCAFLLLMRAVNSEH